MVAAADLIRASTVAIAMEKKRQISAVDSGPRNAASKSDVERVVKRIEKLGLKLADAVTGAGYERATYFRLKKGKASVGTLRDVEEWVVSEETKRGEPTLGTKSDQDALLAEWTSIGDELMGLSPARYLTTLDGLRDVLDSERLAQRAAKKIFR